MEKKNKQNILELLMRLWNHVEKKRQKQFILVFLLMVITSFAEIISISAVFPFLGVLTAPNKIFNINEIQGVLGKFNITSPEEMLLPISIGFGAAALIAGILRILLLLVSTRLSFSVGAELGASIYKRTLYQPYETHCNRNSSEVISAVSNKTNGVIYSIIFPCLTILSNCILLVATISLLVSVNPKITLIIFGGFGLIYILIIQVNRKVLKRNSLNIAKETTLVIKALQEGLGCVRELIIDGAQKTYCKVYEEADNSLRKSQASQLFIGQSPRYAVETLGICLITTVAYFLTEEEGGIAIALPLLGALAMGAQRILPVLQSAYGSWINIYGQQNILKDVVTLLEQKIPEYTKQELNKKHIFEKEIELLNINFKYMSNSENSLNNIELKIKKGARIGFVGATGSGKTTLLDIIMSLLKPTEGNLLVDGKIINYENQQEWRNNIAHVPQTLFLIDGTVAENIAFGLEEKDIDYERVIEVAKQAHLAETIENWPLKYKTLVGERGVRMSGGQRQRIGIARALYKKVGVIVLDEATSALDNETENNIMKEIEKLDSKITILIIAHRITTLKHTDNIVVLEKGKIEKITKYEQLMYTNKVIK